MVFNWVVFQGTNENEPNQIGIVTYLWQPIQSKVFGQLSP